MANDKQMNAWFVSPTEYAEEANNKIELTD